MHYQKCTVNKKRQKNPKPCNDMNILGKIANEQTTKQTNKTEIQMQISN